MPPMKIAKFCIAAFAAAFLTACGGGGGANTPVVTGVMSGLAIGSQVMLADLTTITANGAFTAISTNITISEQPYNQSCIVAGNAINCTNLSTPYQSNGFVIPMWSYTNHADALASLTSLKRNTKANTVIIDFHLITSSLTGNDITIERPNLLDGLKDTVQIAKSLGFDVWFKPLVIVGINGTNWQNLAPTSPAVWFQNYGNALNALADVITPYHTSHFLITNELFSMTTNAAYTQNWASLVSSLRTHYDGKLGFNAGGLLGNCGGCNEFMSIPSATMANMDFVGISAYPRILSPQNYSVAAVSAGWRSDVYGTNLESLLNNYANNSNKPVFITELGSPALYGGNVSPSSRSDVLSQMNFYDGSLAEIKNNMPRVDGVFIYDWLLHVDSSVATDISSPLTWDIYSKTTTQNVIYNQWLTPHFQN